MRQYVATVFDEWVYTTAMYTSDTYEAVLASCDRMAIQAIADAVSGGSVTLTVRLESSTDGIHWANHGNVINAVSIDVGLTNTTVGTDDGVVVLMPRVRLRVSLAGTSPQARVRVIVCGRDTGKGSRAPSFPSATAGVAPGVVAAPPGRVATASPPQASTASAARSPTRALPTSAPGDPSGLTKRRMAAAS
jgi:hypothetical protein